MIRAALALSAFLSVAVAHAQTDNPLKPLDSSSPRATLASFWEQAREIEDAYVAYRADNSFAKMEEIFSPLGRMRQLFDLSEVPAALRDKVGGESALYLFDILLRLPSIDLDTVPGGPGFDAETGLERWSIPDTMIQIVRMEEGPRAGDYLFSSDVVENLPEWHALMGRPAGVAAHRLRGLANRADPLHRAVVRL
jgi:MscS family membrane protein